MTDHVVDGAFAEAVTGGLVRPAGQKRLPCQYSFDDVGAAIFNEICNLQEYYPTRTEMAILQDNLEALVSP